MLEQRGECCWSINDLHNQKEVNVILNIYKIIKVPTVFQKTIYFK